MKRHSKAFGITMNHFHACRHFYASSILEAGVPVHMVAASLGHSDGGRTLLQTYAHTSAAAIAKQYGELRLIG